MKSKKGSIVRFMGICFSIEHQNQHQQQQRQPQSSNGNGCVSKQTEVERQESIGMNSYSSSTMTPKNANELCQSPGYSNVDMFTYEEMRLATKSFKLDFILGEGGFGIVHKGVIDESEARLPDNIKELNHEGLQGDREWLIFVLLFLLIMFSFSLLNRLCFL